ncbi:MAG: hypothetical protein OEZ68_20345 [Gammaproteobacteria bacterium]|nr:hypothetical protein [Gammaproteobacteria bacterium]MDH5803155.1 hypothetical protein [Gammaproteobacteria bacterium]
MTDLICPFSAPQIKKDYDCCHAEEIVRRGGSEYACQDTAAHTRCLELYGKLKQACLSAMNLEDDLLSVPHNTWVKIQYGSLLAIHNLLNSSQEKHASIENIAALMDQLASKFSQLDELPFETIQETVMQYKTKRRSGR